MLNNNYYSRMSEASEVVEVSVVRRLGVHNHLKHLVLREFITNGKGVSRRDVGTAAAARVIFGTVRRLVADDQPFSGEVHLSEVADPSNTTRCDSSIQEEANEKVRMNGLEQLAVAEEPEPQRPPRC